MPLTISLDGRTALVAGAGRGIGEAVATTLAAAGAAVAVVDRDADRAARVAAAIRGSGAVAEPVVADLLAPGACADLVARVAGAIGGIDILVNVAGGAWAYAPTRRLHNFSDDDLETLIGINLRYVLDISRATLAHMVERARGGSIVNIASIAGVFTAPYAAPYSAAKAAVISLTRTLAHEYGPDGIRVNAVAPGRIDTPATPASAMTSAVSEYATEIPIGRLGLPQDIANAVVFLASDLAGYVSGQTLLVDGGASSNPPIRPPSSRNRQEAESVRGQR